MTLKFPHWKTALFCVVMIALAAASNGIMDTLAYRYDRSIFTRIEGAQQWWNAGVSWHNKWKDGDPKLGERFPFSSTTLVGFTDAWHCFKSIAIFCILLAIIAPFTHLMRLPWYGWGTVFFALWLLYGLIFEGLFTHFLIVR